jgi:hypothetical protein
MQPRRLGTNTFCIVASLVLAGGQPSKANKERPRSIEEMQSSSGIVRDGIVTDVVAKQKPMPSDAGNGAHLSDDYEATLKVERTIKGQIKNESVILVYSRVSDPRFTGNNPPGLKSGDRFRLFADEIESVGPPIVIRVRSPNAVRPEGGSSGWQKRSGRGKARTEAADTSDDRTNDGATNCGATRAGGFHF